MPVVLAVEDVIALAGAAPTMSPADASGQEWLNDDDTNLVVKNTSAGTRTLTIASQRDSSFGKHKDYIFTVPVGTEIATLPRVDPRRFNQTTGKAVVTFDSITGVTIGAIKQATFIKDLT